VPESSHPVDAEAFGSFARTTTEAIMFGDYTCDMLEDHIIRLEEIVAAKWPRSMFLRRRLARELRASVAGFGEIAADFRGRRIEAGSQDVVARSLTGRQRRAANPA
jgi:hypothetical protein